MKKVSLIVLTLLLFVFACKKKENDPAPETNNTSTMGGTTAGSNISTNICTGLGNADYYPLKVANSWTYQAAPPANLIYTTLTIDRIDSSVVRNGKTYFCVKSQYGTTTPSFSYYRQDLTGDVYIYEPTFGGTNKEIRYVSSSVNINDTVGKASTGGYYYILSSKTATFSAGSCTYSNLLKIDRYISGNLSRSDLYAKGIGKVGELTSSINTNIINISLSQ